MAEETKQILFTARTKEGSINEKDFTLDAFASTASIDRDGEIILPSAFEKSLGTFRKNPVVLWSHHHDLLPIGRSLSEKIAEEGLLFRPQFAVKESPFAKEVFGLFKAGFLNAFSVGFVPKKSEKREIEGKEVNVFTEVELFEVSAVPVPSNEGALVIRNHGGINMDNVKDLTINKIMEVLLDFQKQSAEEQALIIKAAAQTMGNAVKLMQIIKETL